MSEEKTGEGEDFNKFIDSIKKELDSDSSQEKEETTSKDRDLSDIVKKVKEETLEELKKEFDNKKESAKTNEEVENLKKALEEKDKKMEEQYEKFKSAIDKLSGSRAVNSSSQEKPKKKLRELNSEDYKRLNDMALEAFFKDDPTMKRMKNYVKRQ